MIHITQKNEQQKKRVPLFKLPENYDWKADPFDLKFIQGEAEDRLFEIQEVESQDYDFDLYFNHNIYVDYNWNRSRELLTETAPGFVVVTNGREKEHGIPTVNEALQTGFEMLDVDEIELVLEGWEDDDFPELRAHIKAIKEAV